jgi:hypothetical protein
MIFFSVVLLGSVLYHSDWGFTLSVVLQVLPLIIIRDKFRKQRWLYPVWLAWSGAALLVAGWLQRSEGLTVEPVFRSFGPGYLIMALLAVVWPKWYHGAKGQSDRTGGAGTIGSLPRAE